VLVIGAGKSGALVCALARERVGGRGEVVAADLSRPALEALLAAGACHRILPLDATDASAALAAVQGAGGPFDIVVSCASVPGTEMASILSVRDGGTVLFFSMATSFTAAALGAEGVGKDATLVIGNGYAPGHADLALGLVRRNPALRALLEARYAR
jgi:L-erythro-3,5-diaminohexanoate dehydrogenase